MRPDPLAKDLGYHPLNLGQRTLDRRGHTG